MALTRDGMESKTRHGELANGYSQLVDYEGMPKRPAGMCRMRASVEEPPNTGAK